MVSGFLLLPFYTNQVAVHDYGILALYFGFTLFVQVLANFALDSYIGIHYFDYRDDKKQLREFVGTTVNSLLAMGVAQVLLFSLAGQFIFSLVFSEEQLSFFPFGFISVVTAVFNSFFKTYSNLLIYQQRPMRFLWLNAFSFALIIVITIIGLKLYPQTLIGPMWGRFIASCIVFLLTFLLVSSEFGLHFNRSLIRGILRFCLPFFIYQLLSWTLNNLDRFVINEYLTTKDVAVFDFAVKVVFVIDFFQNGLIAAMNPRVFEIWKRIGTNESTGDVNRYYHVFTLLNLVIIPLFVLAMPIIIPLFVKKAEYFEAFTFFPIIAAGYASRGAYFLFLTPIMYQKRSLLLPKILFISAILQIVITILFLKLFGLIGAAWANMLAKCVQVLIIYLAAKNIFTFKINLEKLIFLPLFYILVNMALYFIPSWEEHMLLYEAAIMIITWIVVLIVFRKELKFVPFLKKAP
jgi:O-antigen/teichoic acid export membrane protein